MFNVSGYFVFPAAAIFTVDGFLRTFDFPKCGNILLIHTRFHGVLRFGHDLGMSFLKQRFHGDLLASFDPGIS